MLFRCCGTEGSRPVAQALPRKGVQWVVRPRITHAVVQHLVVSGLALLGEHVPKPLFDESAMADRYASTSPWRAATRRLEYRALSSQSQYSHTSEYGKAML